MKPAPFEYVIAESWDAAAALLAEHGDDAVILAGGQSLVPVMNFRLAQPAVLVDVNPVADGAYLRIDADRLRVGALTRHVRFEAPQVGGPLGALFPRVARHIAHLPIRMRGTFGGSLAHADPASEWCTLARTFDAVMVARSVRGDRRIDASDYFQAALVNDLADDEVLREIELPALGPDWACGFAEFNRRAGDFAIVQSVAAFELHDGRIVDARIGIGGAAEVPWRADTAEAVLAGAIPSASLFEEAGAAAAESVGELMTDRQASAEMRRDLVRVMVSRALEDALAAGVER
ncbi:MAG: FAD binding domain-containing protein [Alphaproteobacteria bacterium]|nr:FAD binding domain-containing protein [Alphaproteobacteria bacterium]